MTRPSAVALDVRPVGPADRGAVVALWRRCWLDAHAALLPPEAVAARDEAYFLRLFEGCRSGLRAGVEAGRLVAVGLVDRDEIDQIHVAAPRRGSGLAGRFLHWLEAEIAGARHDAVRLFCAVGNERAHRFYRRNGYAEAGRTDYALAMPDGAPPLRLPLTVFVKPLIPVGGAFPSAI